MKQKLALILAATASLSAAVPAVAQSPADDARLQQAQDRFDRETAAYRAAVDQYRAAVRSSSYRDSRGYNNNGYNNNGYSDDNAYYDASRDYRDGSQYQERTLAENDRVYRGNDGRYYCKRNDGTTGLIVGGLSGGILGNIIDGGRSRTVGTLLGAAAGALAGRAIDKSSTQNQIRCR